MKDHSPSWRLDVDRSEVQKFALAITGLWNLTVAASCGEGNTAVLCLR